MSEEIQDNQTAPEPVEVPDKFKNEDGTVNTDALVKSYTDLEKDRSRVVTEVDQLKKQVEASQSSKEMTETLKVIAENTAKKEEPAQTYADYISGVAVSAAEELGLEPDDPAVKLMIKLQTEQANAMTSWTQEDIDKMKEQHRQEIEALKADLSTDKAERVKSTPEYKANKAQIDELVEAGFDESKAIKFVLDKAASTSDVSAPPPGMPANRVSGAKDESSYWSSPEERQRFVDRYGEEETRKLEISGEARIAKAVV